MIGLLVCVSSVALAAANGPTPQTSRPSVAQVTVTFDEPDIKTDPVEVVLVLSQHWKVRGLAPAERQRDPVTTQLAVRVAKVDNSEVLVFEGYRLSAHEQPGDTLVSYALLLEKGPGPQVEGYWYEDHMQIPTTMWAAKGTLDQHHLSLKLTELTDPGIPGVPGTVTGLVRISQ